MILRRQPLGAWLPAHLWPALSAAAGLGSAGSPGSGDPPWAILLPRSSAAEGATDVSQPALACATSAEAVAHGRAVLQLQGTLMQLHVEGTLAAALAPGPRPQRALHGARGEGGTASEERWLAQLRLAHLLLVKGGWNRLCSVCEYEARAAQ
jgi:hypothetical protein